MVKDTKGTQQEITTRLKSKGLDKLTALLNPAKATMSATPEMASPVKSEAQAGGGAVAVMGNQKSEAQARADDVTKHGEINTTPNKANRAQHDEDIDTLITALSMFMPASVIERGGAILIGKLISKLGAKIFKPAVVEEAIERGFRNKKISEPHWSSASVKQAKEELTPAFERGYGPRGEDIVDTDGNVWPGKTQHSPIYDKPYFEDEDWDDIYEAVKIKSMSQYDNPGKGLNSPNLNKIIDKGDYGLQKGKDGKIYYKDINSDWEPLDPRSGWSRDIIKQNFGTDEIKKQMNLLPNIEPEDLRK